MATTSIRQLIEAFPRQLLDGIAAGHKTVSRNAAGKRYGVAALRRYGLVVCGMGGSALPGLLLQHLAPHWRIRIPLTVHRNYKLPRFLSPIPHPLVVCISYSGNTAETLSAYAEARRRRLPLAVIASGGTLAQWADRDGVIFARIEGGMPSRFAIGAQFGALAGILAALRLMPRSAVSEFPRAAASLRPRALRAKAFRSATLLRGRIPLIYAAEGDKALAYVLKIQLNENTKIPAFTHIFPELNHNELNMYADLSPQQRGLRKMLGAAILESPKAHPALKERMRVTGKIIREAGVPLARIAVPGRTPLNRMLNTLVFGEWLSTELALSYNVDPLPTDLIEEFKKRLRR